MKDRRHFSTMCSIDCCRCYPHYAVGTEIVATVSLIGGRYAASIDRSLDVRKPRYTSLVRQLPRSRREIDTAGRTGWAAAETMDGRRGRSPRVGSRTPLSGDAA